MSDTEEKQHQPTNVKLRRARREGSVPHANDVLALAVWPVLIWLVFGWSTFEAGLRRLLTAALVVDYNRPGREIVTDVFFGLVSLAIDIVAPILVIAVIIAIAVAILDNGGFVFSGKPVAPDFSRINPAQGFKRIFSARTAVESGYGLLKLVIFAGIAFAVMYRAVPELQRVQACGLTCAPALLEALVFPLLAFFLAIFLVAAVIDFLLSRQLFKQEMKMSHSELKRENKDTYGNPDVKQRRKTLGTEIRDAPARLGVRAASLVYVGADAAVGVRYVANETPAPFVVFKVGGEQMRETMSEARRLGIPIVPDGRVAGVLNTRGVVGNIIPQPTFTDIARELLRQGLA